MGIAGVDKFGLAIEGAEIFKAAAVGDDDMATLAEEANEGGFGTVGFAAVLAAAVPPAVGVGLVTIVDDCAGGGVAEGDGTERGVGDGGDGSGELEGATRA